MVKSSVKTVIAVPTLEWTHKLVLYYFRLPWSSKPILDGAIDSILVPALNALEWLFGYDYVSHDHDWEGMTITVYYVRRGTPDITLATLGSILAAIAVILLAVGVIILGLAWFVRELRQYEVMKKKSDMLREGSITKEQYEELVAAQKEEAAPWEKALGWGILFIIILLFASARRD